MEEQEPEQAHRPKRSKTGCATCRTRKVRCDEQHPICRACTRLDLACSYMPNGTRTSNTYRRDGTKRRPPRYRVRFVNSTSWSTAPISFPSPPLAAANNHSISLEEGSERVIPRTSNPRSIEDVNEARSAGAELGEADDDDSESSRANEGNFGRHDAHLASWWPKQISRPTPPLNDASDGLGLTSPSTNQQSSPSELLDPLRGIDNEQMGSVEPNVGNMNFFWDSVPVMDAFCGPGFFGGYELDGSIHGITPADASMFEQPHAEEQSPAPSPPALSARPKQMVSIRPEDQEPLQHYLSTMVQYVKLRHSASDDVYCYIFTNMSLSYAPLYEAILAWAALHLAHVKSAPTTDAEARYDRASKLLFADPQPAEHVNLNLITSWFLLQYELVSANGVKRFNALLSYVADNVEMLFQNHDVDLIKNKLGPVAVRVLVWLSAFDARAALFGNPCRLLRCLKTNPLIYELLAFDQLRGLSIGSVSAPGEVGAVEMQACHKMSLRLNIVRGSCILLGRLPGDSFERESTWAALGTSLSTVYKEVEEETMPAAKLVMRISEGDMNVPAAVSTIEYNWMQLLATYFACVIHYVRNRPSSVNVSDIHTSSSSFLPPTAECAARIIRLHRHIALSRSKTPQAIWPHLLFDAGLETTDPIYQSWVVMSFSQMEALGPNLRKTRLLLEKMLQTQRDRNQSYDIVASMNSIGGTFIL